MRHLIALLGRAKFLLVRMYVIASDNISYSCSAILIAYCFILRAADVLVPPAGKHERNEVTLLDVKYLLLMLQPLERIMITVLFYRVFWALLVEWVKDVHVEEITAGLGHSLRCLVARFHHH